MKHAAPEAWLNYVAGRMAPPPERVWIAIGFTSTGPRSKRIGECRDNRCSDDGHLLYCAGFTLWTEGVALLDVDFEVVDPVKLWLLSRRRYLDGDPLSWI